MKMTIGRKLAIGFGGLVLLILIVGAISYSSLFRILDKVDKADDANRLVKFSLEARRAEKNFIIGKDEKDITEVHRSVGDLLKQAKETKAKFRQEANRELMDEVIKNTGAYKKEFDGWVGFWEKQEVLDEDMVKNARIMIDRSLKMQQDQKTELKQLLEGEAIPKQILDKIDKADDANRIVKFSLEARRAEKNFIIRKDEKYIAEVHKSVGDILKQAKETKTKFKQEANRELMDEVIKSTEAYKKGFDGYVALWKKQVKAEEEMVKAARVLEEKSTIVRKDQKSEVQAIFSNTTLLLIVSVLIALLSGITAGILITRAITNPVRQLVSASQTIADGDLTRDVEVKTGDEVGMLADAFQKMVESLRGLVGQTQNTAEKVSATSQELSSSAQEMNATTEEVSSTVQQVATGSTKQAEATEKTSKIIEDISTTIKENASAAQSASAAALEAIENAQTGRNATRKTVEKMEQIDSVINESVSSIRGLKDRSQQIGRIVEVITGFANQTNLLSLNAAIEAARAGESGRGFAVVAEEVRKLAEGSKKSAEEIADLIAEIQAETEKAVISIDSGSKEVTEGMEVVKETGVALEEIIKGVEEAGTMSQQVSSASQQIVEGIEKIVKSIEEISTTAEENASAVQEVSASTEEQTASMEEMASSAQELSDMAIKLAELTAKFKVGGN